jgi:RNA polymerase sigma-70 factor (ECF subfamily)
MAAGDEQVWDEDAALLRAYVQGDEGAFAQLFDRHYGRVYRLVCRYTGASTEAEDLTQTVFLKVMRAAASFEPRARFTTWLYRVTANECLSHLRSSRRGLRFGRSFTGRRSPEPNAEEDASEPVDGRQEDPAEGVAREEVAAEVRRAVLSLPERQRLAVVLSRYEGQTYAEIAVVLGVSAAAVKSLLARAHASLREKLHKFGGKGET